VWSWKIVKKLYKIVAKRKKQEKGKMTKEK